MTSTIPDTARSDPERTVRAHVHIALASVLLAFLAPIVSWALVLVDWSAPRGPWKRRLVALAIFDTVLVIGVALASALGVDVGASEREPPRIGVALDDRDPPGGVAVTQVAPEGPAAAASVRPGDRIVAVDGKPIEHNRELAATIGETRPGSERRITVVRDGTPRELVVKPRVLAREPEPRRAPLFEPVEPEETAARRTSRPFVIGAGVLDLGLVAALALMARRRHARAAPGLAVLAGLIALTLVSSVVLLAFKVTVGVSLGALLIALLSGSVALLVVGLLAIALIGSEPVQVGPRISTPKAIGLGAFYGVAGSTRVAVLAAIISAAVGLPLRSAADAFGVDWSWHPAGIAIFLAATVVVAPIAEEVLFRGVLLPWLARWMRPGAALAWSAIAFAIGHLYYGAGALLIAYYGLVLGWARLRTGKLWAPVAIHALLNGTTAAALLLGRSS